MKRHNTSTADNKVVQKCELLEKTRILPSSCSIKHRFVYGKFEVARGIILRCYGISGWLRLAKSGKRRLAGEESSKSNWRAFDDFHELIAIDANVARGISG